VPLAAHFQLASPIKQAIVVGVAANPEPDESIGRLDRERSVVGADPRRPEPPDSLEMKRWMPTILLQACVSLIGEIAHLRWQGPI
jgi:hypothetical protein